MALCSTDAATSVRLERGSAPDAHDVGPCNRLQATASIQGPAASFELSKASPLVRHRDEAATAARAGPGRVGPQQRGSEP